jgi:hypothetical protein
MTRPPPQVLGFTSENDFKAYFFKHFVWAKVFASRGGTQVRVIFTAHNWAHVFWRNGQYFDLERAERMPWIFEALQRPEEIRQAHVKGREVYLLTGSGWGEDFAVVIQTPNRKGVSHFITAYSAGTSTIVKIRTNPRIWP